MSSASNVIGPHGRLCPRLAEALARGGIVRGVTDGERRALLRGMSDALSLSESMRERATVLPMLASDAGGLVAIGDGIAIPRPENPVISPASPAALRLMYLSEPLEVAGQDGRPIDTLFLIVSPDSVTHRALLSRLTDVLRDDGLRAAILERIPAEHLLAALRRREASASTPAR